MLSGFEERRAAFENEGVGIIAGSVDSKEKTDAFADGKAFPFAYGMSREDADALGAWWQEERAFIQPVELLLAQNGEVLYSSYADGPIGRMDPAETLSFVHFLNRQAKK